MYSWCCGSAQPEDIELLRSISFECKDLVILHSFAANRHSDLHKEENVAMGLTILHHSNQIRSLLVDIISTQGYCISLPTAIHTVHMKTVPLLL